MFPRYLVRRFSTPEVRSDRPYLRHPWRRSQMLWVIQMQRVRPRKAM